MPDREAIQRGLDFEAEVAEALGLDATKASGNQWSDRGDGRGRGLRPSCKSTAKRTWGQSRAQLRESIEISHGTGQIPLLALQDEDGAKLILMRLEDFAEVLNGDRSAAPNLVKRSEHIRAVADIPLLRRAEV